APLGEGGGAPPGRLSGPGGNAARAATADAAERVAAVDEGIEHDAEELVGELERDLLAAGRRFAREQRERVGEIGAGEAEDGHEVGRQRAAVVEEGVERVGAVCLVAA